MPIPTDELDPTPPTESEIPISDESGVAPDAKALATRPGFPFRFVVYPNDPGNWHLVTIETGDVDTPPGTYWLPKAQRLSLTPGQEGVRTVRDGEDPEQAYGEARRRVSARGGVWLEASSLGYLRSAPARDPRTRRVGKVYFDAFESPVPPRPGARNSTVKYRNDREARWLWIARLIRLGVLPEMPDDFVEAHLDRLRGRIVRHMAKTDLPDEVRDRDVAKAVALAEAAEAASVVESAVEARQIAAAARVGAAPAKAPAKKARAPKADARG